MIICLCKAVSDRTIKMLVMHGATDIATIQEKTHVGRGCGQCLTKVAQIIKITTAVLEKNSCVTTTSSPCSQEIHHGKPSDH